MSKKEPAPPLSYKTSITSSAQRTSKKTVNSYNHLSLAPRLDTDNFQNLCKSKKQSEQPSSSDSRIFENKYNEVTRAIKELHQEFLYNCLTEVFFHSYPSLKRLRN